VEKHRFKLLIPISAKLVFITVMLLLAVTVPIALESSKKFQDTSVRRELDNNLEQASSRAIDVEGLFVGYIDKIKVVASLLQDPNISQAEKDKNLKYAFTDDRDLVSVEVISRDGTPPKRIVNSEFLKQYKLNSTYIDQIRKYQEQNNRFQKAAVFANKEHIEIRNASLTEGAPLISIGVAVAVDEEYDTVTKIAVGEVRLDRLQKVFGRESVTSLSLVDSEGNLLAHPDEKKVFQAASMLELPVVKAGLESQLKSGQKSYEIDGKEYIGAFAKTPMSVMIVAEASKDIILEAAKAVQREAFYIAGRVLSVAIFVVFIFSITLTAPIEKLVEVTTEIARGNFDVKANVRSRDEVGALGNAVDEMVVGLQERDKVKNVLNKFHGSSVAEDMIKGDLELGGSDKYVTVFFSDIRDFTKYSEAHTAAEVVDMLNEYFQVMVSIVNQNNGVVDKFVGDAIMAIWGAPTSSETDAHDAVKACLEMRMGLEELNERRIERGEVPLKIGIGLHTGTVISGNIGSDERMEYTVIGDTVNQAARIEASTKAFGADLLLSQGTVDAVKDKFIVELAGSAEVKGKSEALHMYKVRGYIDENGQEVIVKTPYSDYEAGDADKVKVAS
jgi:adenylate cyclase